MKNKRRRTRTGLLGVIVLGFVLGAILGVMICIFKFNMNPGDLTLRKAVYWGVGFGAAFGLGSIAIGREKNDRKNTEEDKD